MLRTIHLHNSIAQFAPEPFQINVDSVGTLLNALHYLLPGFTLELRKCEEMGITLSKGEEIISLTTETLQMGFGDYTDIHIIPSVSGQFEGAAAWMASAASGATAGWASVSGYSAFVYAAVYVATSVALAYAMGSIASALVDSPKTDGPSTSERKSALFDGPTNLVGVGHPIPVVYGRCMVGSVNISSCTVTERVAIASHDFIEVETNTSKTVNIFDNDVLGTSLSLVDFSHNGVVYLPGATVTGPTWTASIALNGTMTFNDTGTNAGTDVVFYYKAELPTGTSTAESIRVGIFSRGDFSSGVGDGGGGNGP